MHEVTRRTALGVALAAASAAAFAGCSQAKEEQENPSSTEAGTATENSGNKITVSDAWIKAASDGMTAMFGTIEFNGADGETALLEAAATDAADMCELHEVVTESGSSTMRKVDKGFEIVSGTPFVMEPGGYHVMLMGLVGPLEAGQEVKVTLTFHDLEPVEVTAQVKDFSGADENYGEDMHDHEGHDHEGHDHEGHDHEGHEHSSSDGGH